MIQHIHSISEPSLWYLPNFNKWEWSYNMDFSEPAQNFKKNVILIELFLDSYENLIKNNLI